MLRIARVALFAAIPVEMLLLVLLLAGVTLPGPVIAAAEAIVIAVLLVEATVGYRLFAEARRGGVDRRAALRAAYARMVPEPVRRIMGFDVKGMASLVRWVARRRHGVPPGATAVPYSGAQTATMLMFVVVLVLEPAVIEVLLRAVGAPVALRAALLAVAAYTIVGLLGVVAGCVTRPHVVTDDEVRIRYGVFFDLRIPRDHIAEVRRVRNYTEGGTTGLQGPVQSRVLGAPPGVDVEGMRVETAAKSSGGRAAPRYRWLLATAVLVAGTVAGPALTGTGPAAAAMPAAMQGTAWLLADRPATAGYTPADQGTTVESAPDSAVKRTSAGKYVVRLPKLGASAGTVFVTAHGPGNAYCKPGGWGPDGTTQTASVYCFTANGSYADSQFTLTYTNPKLSSSDEYGYVWANLPTEADYVPSSAYQVNSKGGENRIRRVGTGQYDVEMAKLGDDPEGNIQINAYGSGAARCKSPWWEPHGTTQKIRVRCHGPSGQLVDTTFTAAYFSGTGHAVVPARYSGYAPATAYVWADKASEPFYAPAAQYARDSMGGDATVKRFGKGDYRVTLVDSYDGPWAIRSAHVTAHGPGPEYCKLDRAERIDNVIISCYDAAGAAVDSRFTASMVGQDVYIR